VVPDLGILTTSLGRVSDTPIVQRSWGLLGGPDFYGPNFHFTEFMKSRNYLTAFMTHVSILVGSLFIAIPFVRTLARKYGYQPGDGPTKEEIKNDRVEYRGIATPDVKTPNPPRAYCRACWEGSMYQCKSSGLLVESNANLNSHWSFDGTSSYFDLARRS
jgi:hypothetical protein